jgi:phage recombination protein Bet
METHTKPPITQDQLELIKNTVAAGATADELKLFMVIANRSGLDPFTRQIHFVKRGGRATIQTGIDGYRAIAERTGQLAGIDDPIYDTESEQHPNKATVTVYRMVGEHRVPFTASARWSEYVPQQGQDFMWRKMPYLMLGKVAESLALRKAFPNDLSGLYTDEEMQQAPQPDDGYDMVSGVYDESQHNEKPVSDNQRDFIGKLMSDKGITEDDLAREGFDKMDELTGGRNGTASELIDWLINSKNKKQTAA